MVDLYKDYETPIENKDEKGREKRQRSEDTPRESSLHLGKPMKVDVVPLCANCVVEVELDKLDARSVLQRGLRRIDKVDGGLTRRRWEMQEGEMSRGQTATSTKVSLNICFSFLSSVGLQVTCLSTGAKSKKPPHMSFKMMERLLNVPREPWNRQVARFHFLQLSLSPSLTLSVDLLSI